MLLLTARVIIMPLIFWLWGYTVWVKSLEAPDFSRGSSHIYEQQKEAYEYALAYAQELVYLLQKRITEIEKLEEAYHRKFVSLAAALKKDVAFMLKERKLRELKESK